jgi:hypothetical protein
MYGKVPDFDDSRDLLYRAHEGHSLINTLDLIGSEPSESAWSVVVLEDCSSSAPAPGTSGVDPVDQTSCEGGC